MNHATHLNNWPFPPSEVALIADFEAVFVRSLATPEMPCAALEEACQRYQLTEEEFRSWQRAYETHGLPGLRATRLQQYRSPLR